jgi:hypothetical protein
VQLNEGEREVRSPHKPAWSRERVPVAIGRDAVDKHKVENGDTRCEVADEGGNAIARDRIHGVFVA